MGERQNPTQHRTHRIDWRGLSRPSAQRHRYHDLFCTGAIGVFRHFGIGIERAEGLLLRSLEVTTHGYPNGTRKHTAKAISYVVML